MAFTSMYGWNICPGAERPNNYGPLKSYIPRILVPGHSDQKVFKNTVGST